MSDVLIRYGCEGCRRWTDNPDEFKKVEVRPFNSKGDLPERIDLYCPECFRDRESRYRGVGLGVPGVQYAD